MELKCKINGEEVTLRAEPTARLRDVLYRAGYRSVRDSDDAEGFAGSDTIVFNGKLKYANFILFYQAEGARGSRYAFLRTGVEDGFITGDTADAVMNYMKAIEEAVKITDDINARYDAFANAEASLINNALVVPMGMSIPAYIATRLNYWEGQYASTGFSNKRLKGIHVLDHYISMSEYEANRDAR